MVLKFDIDKLPSKKAMSIYSPNSSVFEYLFCICANLNFRVVLIHISLITSKVEHPFIHFCEQGHVFDEACVSAAGGTRVPPWRF